MTEPHHRIRVAQFGLGPIGQASLRLLNQKPWAQIVGGIDIDPAKQGMSLGELVEQTTLDGIGIYPSFRALCQDVRPDVVLHTAGSSCAATIEQLLPMVDDGVHVATTCETMLYPWLTEPRQADLLDAAAETRRAVVLGTGVNPGFAMDLLPVVASGVMPEVTRVYAERVVDATTRRGPLQAKIGSGLAPQVFHDLFEQGKAGHAGFRESAALVAHAMGWTVKPQDIHETLEPVVASAAIQTPYAKVEPGQTRGLHQVVTAHYQGREVIRLDLTMALGEAEPHDMIQLEGEPGNDPLILRFPKGIPGDDATVAALVNNVPGLFSARPGLRLMTEMPAPRHRWAPSIPHRNPAQRPTIHVTRSTPERPAVPSTA